MHYACDQINTSIKIRKDLLKEGQKKLFALVINALTARLSSLDVLADTGLMSCCRAVRSLGCCLSFFLS